MTNKNSVFIATSLDGFIADKNGGVDWLHSTPNPENLDLGYNQFNKQLDAIVMGRNTFDIVCGFNIDWPYTIPVYVLSNSMKEIPTDYKGKAFLVKGSLSKILIQIHENGHHSLYIDGGSTIQSFLNEDLIDEIIITMIPVLLGGGIPLFSNLNQSIKFELKSPQVHINQLVKSHFIRKIEL